MNKFEDWFLDEFWPGLKHMAQYIGILTIEAGLAFLLSKLLGWDFYKCFIGVFILFGLLVVKLKDRRLLRRITFLAEQQRDDISLIIQNGRINHELRGSIERIITKQIFREGFEEFENGDIASKVRKIVFGYARKWESK